MSNNFFLLLYTGAFLMLCWTVYDVYREIVKLKKDIQEKHKQTLFEFKELNRDAKSIKIRQAFSKRREKKDLKNAYRKKV